MSLRKKLSLAIVICLLVTQVASLAYAEVVPTEITEKIEQTVEQEETKADTETVVEEIVEEKAEEKAEDLAPKQGDEVKQEETQTGDAIVLTDTCGDVVVTLKAPVDAFDNKGELTLKVTEVEISESEKSALKECGSDDVNVAKRVTYDITVLDDGEEIQPKKEVDITFDFKDAPSGADGVNIYHHENDDKATKIDTEVLKEDAKEEIAVLEGATESDAKIEEIKEAEKTEAVAATDKNIDAKEVSEEELAETDDVELEYDLKATGKTDGFSHYTVDFTYKDMTISIAGDSTGNKLDDITKQLGITEKVEEAHAYNDPEEPEEIVEGETESAVKNSEGETLFSIYQEDETWYVDAVNAFQTEHGLIVKTEDGAEYKIKVTDDTAVTEYKYNVKYIDKDGVLQSCPKATVVSNTMNGVWPAGWYVAVGTITMKNASVAVEGAVHLILTDGCILNISAEYMTAGIRVSGSSNSLTIYGQSAGTGELNAISGYYGAGIGGAKGEAGENITINGGTITATGKASDYFDGGAGIGGGAGSSIGEHGKGVGKNIIINGGTVTAKSDKSGAGIGGAWKANGSDITINGGIVTAIGGKNGAGIGGGLDGEGNNITINGGIVTVTGGNNGAGIGGGYQQKGNNIRIYGGQVTATAGNSATGIGGGSDGTSATACYDIYASKEVVVKAGSSYPPTTEIKPGHDINTQLGVDLYGNRYVTAVLASTAVTLDANGGTPGSKTEVQVSLGSDMPALSSSELPIPSAAGNSFTGFFDAADGGKMYYRPDGKSARRWDKSGTTAILYAHWAAPTDIGSATIDAIPTQTYTGSAITPDITVRCGGSILESGTDYTVEYSNNANAGTAIVTVIGTGIYTGSKGTQFTIDAKSIADAQISGIPASSAYNGQEQKLIPTVSVGGKVLTNGNDFTLAYTNNKDVGNAAVTVTGKGNYAGEISADFTIIKASLTLTSDSASKVYDKTPLTSKHVTSEGFVAGEGAVYDVTGSQTDVGTSKNTFTYTMNSGTKESNYEIKKIEGDLVVTKAPEYLVKFDVQGHGTTPAAVTVMKGDKVNKPTNPAATGYVFEGWYKEKACVTEWNFAVDTVSEDMTLYAKWTDKMFTVTYVTQGHGTAPAQQTVREGDKLTKPVDPAETGYVFDGWYRESGCTTKWMFDSDIVTGNMVLFAKWTDKMYEVSFDANGHGTAPGKQTVREGDKLTKPADPVYSGEDVKFAGWFKDQECKKPWNFAADTVTKDMTLYAYWVPYDYLVIFANSKYKDYDGIAMSDPGYTCSGLKEGHEATIKVEGSITDAGTAENNVTEVIVKNGETDVTKEYTIVAIPGVLTVNKKKLTVTGTTIKDKLYDGTNASEIDDPGTVTGIVGIDEGKITVSGTAVFLSKNAGADNSVLVEYQIGGERADNYEKPDSKELKAEINRRTVVMTSASAKKAYDGKSLKADGVTVSGDGFVSGEGADYYVTGSQTEIGTSKNTFTYSMNSGTKESNYNVTKIEGDLIVTAISISEQKNGSTEWTSVPTMIGSAAAPISNGSWINTNGVFQYKVNGEPLRNSFAWITYKGADGKQYTGCFYFDKSGNMAIGWQKIAEEWYFFDTTQGSGYGIMKTSGWIESNGKQYYIGADGKMLVNTTTPDGKVVGADGAMSR